jgi:putative serine protease PepD
MSAASRFLPILGGAIAGGAIALAVSSGTTSKSVTTTTVVPVTSGASAEPTSISRGGGMTVYQIAKSAMPGVVDIKVTAVSNTGSGVFGGGGAQQQTQGEGSGVVYDSAGHILTDEHVISGATSVTVTFSDGRSYPATVVGSDKSTDVGVIKVNAPASELHPLKLADSAKAQVGDAVVAIGSPFGLADTVTSGIVSATGRSIQAPNNYTITGAIQTDAAINQGNSGGPLLDANAQVLGLNDQIETNSGSSAGVGFAVPSDTVKRVADSLIAGQSVKHSYLGVQLQPLGQNGATIAQVQTGTPAQAVGLQQGDVITALDGMPISTTDQFIAQIDQYAPGTTVTLTIQRGGVTKQVSVKLGTRPGS